MHGRLRAALEVARSSPSAELALYCAGFCAALGGHHRAEDATLFPEVVAEHPSLAPVIAKLTEDHDAIAALLVDFDNAVRAGASAVALQRHLDGLAAIMDSHFSFEERALADVLDELSLNASTRDALGPL